MASIDSCNSDIQKYRNIKTNIQSIINYLSAYNSDTDDLVRSINTSYQVDSDETCLVKSIELTQEDVQKTSNYLKNTIIPAIDNAINRLNNTIAQIRSEQKAAEEAAQAEAAKAAEAAQVAAQTAARAARSMSWR